MRAVIQRVNSASIRIDGAVTASIDRGLLALIAVAADDSPEDGEWLAAKLLGQKLFDSPEGSWRADLATIGGELLLVSQFTLLASTRKGTRPSWHRAAPPTLGEELFELFRSRCVELLGRPVQTGIFGADMEVELKNDGPVTLILDSRLRE